MDFVYQDFNVATAYFAGAGAQEWSDIDGILRQLPIFFQASQQAGIGGSPIFDPKATNAFLATASTALGWRMIPVPAGLTEFGMDWDGGKGASLAEWQFSNYPFLWNNVIRSEAVYKGSVTLQGLIIVTKSGLFPASNSTLYYEQALAQIQAVTSFGAFGIPIRLVGLTVLPGTATVNATWSSYSGRYSRAAVTQAVRVMQVRWSRRPGKYGSPRATFV